MSESESEGLYCCCTLQYNTGGYSSVALTPSTLVKVFRACKGWLLNLVMGLKLKAEFVPERMSFDSDLIISSSFNVVAI